MPRQNFHVQGALTPFAVACPEAALPSNIQTEQELWSIQSEAETPSR